MPLESRKMMMQGETLLDICLELHASNSGAADPIDNEYEDRCMSVLRTAVSHWKAGSSGCERFDNAVLELCKATISETQAKR